MPRQARLDISGVLQHVIVRGIEQGEVFRDDDDRRRFVERLNILLRETGTECLAWALIPNHFHLLLRCHRIELSRFMRRLLTGYAVYFNHRHQRSGHLFHNRYKSIVCEENTYLLELIRYIHLNPLRAGLVANLKELESYPWCGHGVLLGTRNLSGQTLEEVLLLFGKKVAVARRGYLQFVGEGVTWGKRPELVGGGLRRSQRQLAGQQDSEDYDERILGSGAFVRSLRQEEGLAETLPLRVSLEQLKDSINTFYDLAPGSLQHKGRRNAISEARAVLCCLAVKRGGYSGSVVGTHLGIGVSSVSRAIRRAEQILEARPEVEKDLIAMLRQ
jgi:putative transposase